MPSLATLESIEAVVSSVPPTLLRVRKLHVRHHDGRQLDLRAKKLAAAARQ